MCVYIYIHTRRLEPHTELKILHQLQDESAQIRDIYHYEHRESPGSNSPTPSIQNKHLLPHTSWTKVCSAVPRTSSSPTSQLASVQISKPLSHNSSHNKHVLPPPGSTQLIRVCSIPGRTCSASSVDSMHVFKAALHPGSHNKQLVPPPESTLLTRVCSIPGRTRYASSGGSMHVFKQPLYNGRIVVKQDGFRTGQSASRKTNSEKQSITRFPKPARIWSTLSRTATLTQEPLVATQTRVPAASQAPHTTAAPPYQNNLAFMRTLSSGPSVDMLPPYEQTQTQPDRNVHISNVQMYASRVASSWAFSAMAILGVIASCAFLALDTPRCRAEGTCPFSKSSFNLFDIVVRTAVMCVCVCVLVFLSACIYVFVHAPFFQILVPSDCCESCCFIGLHTCSIKLTTCTYVHKHTPRYRYYSR